MLKTIKNLISSSVVALMLAFGFGFVVPVAVNAKADNAIQQELCKGIRTAEGSTTDGEANTVGCYGEAGTDASGIQKIVRTVINIFSLLVGSVSVIMIIVGGFKYITSGGDSGKVGGAKNTIVYALIGLVLVALSQVIVRFVLSNAANAV